MTLTVFYYVNFLDIEFDNSV